ncbi:MAG TPA: hypothetical protein VGO11_23400 [Chthoniobacteraceae bacterium]|jgi:hypothetical protein|nr:hypothetical protein [Chthoniobacteraceae bacterium]
MNTHDTPRHTVLGLAAVALFLALFVPGAFAESAPIDELQKLMKTSAAEMMEGKPDTMLAHTLPSVLTLLGGEEKAKEILTKGLQSMASTLELMGYKIKSYTAGEPEKTRTEGDTTFVLLPTTMIAEGEEGKVTEKSYVLGIWKAGPDAKWYLLRLAMPEERVRQVVPELPKDFTWPARQAPVVEKR